MYILFENYSATIYGPFASWDDAAIFRDKLKVRAIAMPHVIEAGWRITKLVQP